MKKRGLIIIVLILFIQACSPFHFYDAMPISSKPIKYFNEGLIGKYVLKDSIIILKNEVHYNSRYFDKSLMDKDSISFISVDLEIDKEKIIYGVKTYDIYNINKVDTVRLLNKHRNEIKIYDKDQVLFHTFFSDTIIDLKRKDVQKEYGGKLYLNRRIDKHDWEVYEIRTESIGNISLNTVNEEDKKKLEKYIVEKSILGDIIRLSDKQFNDFVKSGGFRGKYRFMRVLN